MAAFSKYQMAFLDGLDGKSPDPAKPVPNPKFSITPQRLARWCQNPHFLARLHRHCRGLLLQSALKLAQSAPQSAATLASGKPKTASMARFYFDLATHEPRLPPEPDPNFCSGLDLIHPDSRHIAAELMDKIEE